MREFTQKQILIKSKLSYLFDTTYKNDENIDRKFVEEFIDVGEWALAADQMAFEYLSGRSPMTKIIFQTFVDLADLMHMLSDPTYENIQMLIIKNKNETIS